MNQVVAIAVNTFKETIRDRVLAVIVVFALLMIAGGLWLGSISLGEQGRMMKDFGLVAVTAFGLIVAVFVAAGLVHKEVEKRTVFVLFSKPVSRVAFISGKFVGSVRHDGGRAGRHGAVSLRPRLDRGRRALRHGAGRRRS